MVSGKLITHHLSIAQGVTTGNSAQGCADSGAETITTNFGTMSEQAIYCLSC